MKIKVEKGVMKIELADLVAELSAHDAKELARQLVADKELFGAVLECVADDSRYCGHFFSTDPDGAWSFDRTAVLELREKLIPLMPEISKQIIRAALQQRNDERTKAARMWDWAWKMYHMWPDTGKSRPELPISFYPAPEPTEEEINKL